MPRLNAFTATASPYVLWRQNFLCVAGRAQAANGQSTLNHPNPRSMWRTALIDRSPEASSEKHRPRPCNREPGLPPGAKLVPVSNGVHSRDGEEGIERAGGVPRNAKCNSHSWRRSRTGEDKSFAIPMVALLVDAKLMRIPVRLEVTPKGKVGHVFVRLVIEGLCV